MLQGAILSLEKSNNQNIELLIKDSKREDKNIITSYYELINENVDIILGPVFSENIKLISPIAKTENTMIITFSNNTEVIDKNIFISGLTPEDEIRAIFNYMLPKGKKKYGLILPNNNYGNRSKNLITEILNNNDAELIQSVFYNASDPDFYKVARKIANFEEREKNLKKRLEELKNLNTSKALKEYEILKDRDTLGNLEFDCIYIGVENIKHLSMITSILPYYDVDPKLIIYIGNSLWSHSVLLKEPALEGGIFSNVIYGNYKNFEDSYINTFEKKPHKISSLAYDIIGLISILQQKNKIINYENITNSSGFLGTNGLFRFRKNGNIERKLSIYQIKKQKIIEIKKADLVFN